jgi:hypothetical protein
MEWLKYTGMVMAAFLVVFGLVTLVMAWLAPRSLDTPFMKGMLTGERLLPTRRNRVLASAGSVLFGTYLWLALASYAVPALLVAAAWLAVTVLLRRARTPAQGSSA